MCVSAVRATLFDRAEFFAVVAAAATPLAQPERALAADAGTVPLPPPPPNMSPPNARAAAIAARSPLVRATYGYIVALANSIGDTLLRESVLELLHDPVPRFMRAYPTAASRLAMRDKLAATGFVTADAAVEGIFPATTLGRERAPQPFWSTPGSSQDSHHAYPGGLGIHELFNARMAVNFTNVYDRMYLAGRRASRDVVVGAALYHDIMKSVVFQWNEDGTLFKELQIGGTGGHHVLSGAEAIARRRDPQFVIALLSAHAAPSLGDEEKVITWIRAATMLAGVDPIEYNLLRKDGDRFVLAGYAPMEAFISHLSDHDYVFSVHAMHEIVPQLRRLAPRYGHDPASPQFMWWRNAVLANASGIRLYDTLARDGERSFDRQVAQVSATLALE
jgi:hypothetical protein